MFILLAWRKACFEGGGGWPTLTTGVFNIGADPIKVNSTIQHASISGGVLC